jgi:hypothetical protein
MSDVVLPGMFGTLFGLFSLHGKQREVEREKRMQYWREQVCTISSIAFSLELTTIADCFPSEHPAGERIREAVIFVSRFCQRAE